MSDSSLPVPRGLYYTSAAFQRSQKLWKILATLETALLKDDLQWIEVDAPIYIAGMARSGSTILLEMLNRHPDLTSHRYSDFPNIYTPYWHNWLKQRVGRVTKQPQERAHQDRIQITEDSPEAIEEVLWMAFFPNVHDAGSSQVLTADNYNPAFESFYHDHIRKLLMVRNRKRYLAKGNYNLTRLAYIKSLYARFIIPLRHPVNHIASLIKQDALFNNGLVDNPHARRYLAWVGHFEFGPDKRPIHAGDGALVQEIRQSWRQNHHVRAWALYWNALYRFAADQLASDSSLRDACLWIRYEDLCASSAVHIDRILHHCGLSSEGFGPARSYYIDHLSEPDYYRVKISQTERRLISDICGETAARLGYPLK